MSKGKQPRDRECRNRPRGTSRLPSQSYPDSHPEINVQRARVDQFFRREKLSGIRKSLSGLLLSAKKFFR